MSVAPAHGSSVQSPAILPQRAVPIAYEADVVVVGAGPGGFAAALQAARMGASVVVVERFDMPGGVHTSGLQGSAGPGVGGIHTEPHGSVRPGGLHLYDGADASGMGRPPLPLRAPPRFGQRLHDLYIGHPTLDMSPVDEQGTYVLWQNMPYGWALHMDDDANDHAKARQVLRGFISAEARFLRKYVPGFENAVVANVGRLIGSATAGTPSASMCSAWRTPWPAAGSGTR